MNQESHKIFQALYGQWEFIRTIENQLTPAASGTVLGTASFIPVADRINLLHYTEHGEFKISSGIKIKCSQEYFYSLSKTGEIEIYFANAGTPAGLFQTLNQKHSSEHICRLDKYLARFSVCNEVISIIYQVKGPNKKYIHQTSYHRI